MKVATNTVVSLRYSMTNERGDLLEDIMNREPVDYLHGSGNILPALEANLEGLECGAQRSISVSFETNPDRKDSFHFEVIIDKVRAATPEELLQRKPLQPFSKEDCGPDCCC